MTRIPESGPAMDIASLLHGYRNGDFTPTDILDLVRQRIASQPEHNAWITRLTPEQLEPFIAALAGHDPDSKPLYGIPFAIKDNIDLAGIPTTAACPEYAYVPDEHAPVVQALIEAGAIPVGKTNLDQFATGLVGSRSPYGPGRNAFDPDYISGGSSSGSAIAVALGQVSFGLGTDTAGSGRVPAAFNNLLGHKPTRGRLSTRGVVPACRTLDCVSIFTLGAGDAARVLEVGGHFDAADPYARPRPQSEAGFSPHRFRFGVPQPAQLEFFDNPEGPGLFEESIGHLEALGGEAVEIDFEPFLETARLLYEGPWVSERYVAIEDFITRHPEALYPVTFDIIRQGANYTASDTFQAIYRLQELRRRCEAVWQELDVMLTPTAARHYTIEEVQNDPVRLNSRLGYYTNFMNLLDLAATAVPAGFQTDGLPFGVTLFAPAFSDTSLLTLADRLQHAAVETAGALGAFLPAEPDWPLPSGWIPVAVCGAHLSGLPLNHQLTERGGYLLETTRTAPQYRLHALPGGPPHRPGLVRASDTNGAAIEIEIWALPLREFGSFVAGIPAPLGIGTLLTESGRAVQGFLCEAAALEGATDITALGSWRKYEP